MQIKVQPDRNENVVFQQPSDILQHLPVWILTFTDIGLGSVIDLFGAIQRDLNSSQLPQPHCLFHDLLCKEKAVAGHGRGKLCALLCQQ